MRVPTSDSRIGIGWSIGCRGCRFDAGVDSISSWPRTFTNLALYRSAAPLAPIFAGSSRPCPHRFPVSRQRLEASLSDLAGAFLANPQVREAVADLRAALGRSAASYAHRTPDDWVAAYEEVSQDRHYNDAAEILIEAVGFGTYPLVRACNAMTAGPVIGRTTYAACTPNRRSLRMSIRRQEIIRRLARMIPVDVNWINVHTAYLHRKVGRIVGPQSAVNPMENYTRSVIRDCALPPGFSLVEGIVLDTFASTLIGSSQLGTWRVSLAPVFER